MEEQLWINDLNILFSNNNYFKIVPNTSMSLNQKLNSLTRFSIIFSLLLYIFTQNYLYLYIFVIVFVIIYLLNLFNKEFFSLNNNEKLENCQKPTNDNPLMNVLLTDDFENKKQACDFKDTDVEEVIDNKLNKNFDINTMYNKMNQYNYYTMPNTKVPNDQNAFAQWLYNSNKNCEKDYEKNKNCFSVNPYNDLKNKHSNFENN